MDDVSNRQARVGSAPAGMPAPAPAAAGGVAQQQQKPVGQSEQGGKSDHRESGVKETIESILIAFILAFMFRAFVVEAFVIPTGSMATTLLGAHIRFACPDCGYRFDVNYNARSGPGDELTIPSRAGPEKIEEQFMGRKVVRFEDKVYDVRCPNCACELPKDERTNPPVRYGDRILVLKYLYLFQEPKRWDVVVFKSPDDAAYQQNFIKRLVGKPGESVMILDGDVYIGKGPDTGTYEIQSKPRYVQQDLWRNIYDNDYYPMQRVNRADPWRQPWVVADQNPGWSGLETVRGEQHRIFEFDNMQGRSTIRFDPNANRTNPFTDFLAYDIEEVQRVEQRGQRYLPNPVSDLKVEFYYQRKAGDGPLRVRLTKGTDGFEAELTPGKARLLHQRAGELVVIGEAEIDDQRAPVKVELENHDYRVSLRVGGREVIATTPQQYRPNVKQLLAEFHAGRPGQTPAVQISAETQQSRITHLKLARDIYYISVGRRLDGAPFAGTPENLMHLGADEYFVLGDNALISGDARYWIRPIRLDHEELDVQPGRVPARFMLGKAFFVYWPAGFRPFPGAPPLAPDFGDMRFIR